MRLAEHFISFFTASSINLIIQEHEVRFYLTYDIKITLKSHFCRKNIIILFLCTQRCYGRHNVSRKSINHQWFIDFIAWRYFTPRRGVI